MARRYWYDRQIWGFFSVLAALFSIAIVFTDPILAAFLAPFLFGAAWVQAAISTAVLRTIGVLIFGRGDGTQDHDTDRPTEAEHTHQESTGLVTWDWWTDREMKILLGVMYAPLLYFAIVGPLAFGGQAEPGWLVTGTFVIVLTAGIVKLLLDWAREALDSAERLGRRMG